MMRSMSKCENWGTPSVHKHNEVGKECVCVWEGGGGELSLLLGIKFFFFDNSVFYSYVLKFLWVHNVFSLHIIFSFWTMKAVQNTKLNPCVYPLIKLEI